MPLAIGHKPDKIYLTEINASETPSSPMTPSAVVPTLARATSNDRAIALWLLACCALIFAMAVIGAITRLTESGLSIMEWAPLTGVVPPLSEAEWTRLFALYQQTPEYREVNLGLSLGEFKRIFWWEYVHRLWGRLTAVCFAIPFAWFLLRGQIRRAYVPHLATIFVLGGLQGLLGWYMVASGFADRTDVSQYRLAAHLMMAVLIYSYALWMALRLLFPRVTPVLDRRAAMLEPIVAAWTALVVATIASGAFVAGLNAGMTYNTFPLMDGQLVPDGYFTQKPWYWNWFENVAAVQFNHRILALVTLLSTAILWGQARRLDLPMRLRTALDLMMLAVIAQAGLGIATLLLVVPVWLGALHQAGALAVLTLALFTLYQLRGGTTGVMTPRS